MDGSQGCGRWASQLLQLRFHGVKNVCIKASRGAKMQIVARNGVRNGGGDSGKDADGVGNGGRADGLDGRSDVKRSGGGFGGIRGGSGGICGGGIGGIVVGGGIIGGSR